MREQTMVRVGGISRRFGAGAVARAISPPSTLRVVLSHYVLDRDMDNFRTLLTHLAGQMAPVTPEQVVARYGGADWPAGESIAFTFDDGLLSSYDAAQQVLNPLGLKAMFFVPTAILDLRGDGEMRDFYRRQVYRDATRALAPELYRAMTAEHLRELRAQGHMILPHTHDHVRLADLAAPDLARQIDDAKAIVEDLVQAEAPAFAFPFGSDRDVSGLAYQRVIERHHLCFTGLGGRNSHRTDPHFLFRDCVHPHFSLDHAHAVCSGAFDLFYSLKMRRLKHRAAAT